MLVKPTRQKRRSCVLAIPDLQQPFAHQDAFDFIRRLTKEFRPTTVVNMGDEIDFHAMGEWDHDPDGYSAGHELERAIESMKNFYKLHPETLVCTSNHTSRPFRKAFKHGIPVNVLKSYRDMLQAPSGWSWADHWEIDGVIYEHGTGFSGRDGALKAALGNMQSTVIGHLPAWAGIQYAANSKHLLFGFNTGCLIDRHAYAFRYGKDFKNKPILGAGIIQNGQPLYIPMQLNPRGRWTGRL